MTLLVALAGIGRADAATFQMRVVSVGITPVTITVDEQISRAFVVSIGPPYSVSTLDTHSGAVLRTVAASNRRFDTAAGPVVVEPRHKRAFLLNYLSRSMSVFDAATGQRLRTVPLDFGATTIAVDAPRGQAFLSHTSDEGKAGITVVDTARGRLVRTLHMDSGTLVIDDKLGRGFVGTDAGVSMFDTSSGRILHVSRVAGAPIGVDTAHGRVFVLSSVSGTPFSLSVLDTHTGALVRKMPLPTEMVYGMVLDARRGRAFLPLGTTIRVFDTVTGQLVHTIPRYGATLSRFGTNPLAVDQQTGHLFIISNELDRAYVPTGPGYLQVLDAPTGSMLSALRLPDHLVAVGLDARARRVLVVSSPSGPGMARKPGKVTTVDLSHG